MVKGVGGGGGGEGAIFTGQTAAELQVSDHTANRCWHGDGQVCPGRRWIFFRGSPADGGRWAHRGTVLCPLNDVRARLLAVHVWKNRSSVSPVSAN